MADSREIKLIINGQAAEGSLNVLYKKASELKKVLNQLDPNDERVAEFNRELTETQARIDNARGAMGMLKTTTSSFGDTLATIGKATFWLAILQFVYEWAKGFIAVTQEVAKTRKEISLLTDATGKDLDDLTTRVTAIGKTFGADYKEVIKSANSVAKAFGITQKEAFEYIEKGFIANGEAFTDKLTNLQEYPVQFANAGMGAEKYFKIVNQEIKGGIFDNKLQDTLKELDLSMELTKAQQDALAAAFGQDFTNKFFKDIDTGAITTEQGLMRIVTEAKKTGLSVTTMKTLTADLFKSGGEDSGGLLKVVDNLTQAFDRSLDSTNEYAIGNKAALDSAKVLTSAQNDLAAVLEKQNGNFQRFANEGLALAANLLKLLIEKGFEFGKFIFDVGASIGELLKSFGLLNENTDLGAKLISAFSFAMEAGLIPLRLILVIIRGVADGFTWLTNSVQSYLSTSPNLTKFFSNIGEYLSVIGSGLSEVAKGFTELFTKVGLIPEKKTVTLETKKVETDSKGTEIANKTDSNVQTEAEKAAQKAREANALKAKQEAKKLEDEKLKDEIKANEIRQALRIKNISDETERQKEELQAKALKDAQEINLLKINEFAKADLRKQISENLSKDLQAIDDKAFADKIQATIDGNKIIDDLEKQRVDKLNADKISQANADVINAEISKDPQAIFDAKIAQLATEREIELANLELSEAAKNEIIARYTQEKKQIEDDFTTHKIDLERGALDAFASTVNATANLLEQDKANRGKNAEAIKAFKIAGVMASVYSEIAGIWENANNNPINALIPGFGAIYAAAQTGLAVGRATFAVGNIASQKFADGGLLQGNSHANGGIRGSGKFGAFEAEGGEFFVNKQATANNLSALSMLNTYGRNMSFDLVPRIKFAMGGQLPNNIPSQALGNSFANQGIAQTNDMFMQFNEQISGLRNDINNFETNKKTYIVYTELETVANDVTQIRSYGG